MSTAAHLQDVITVSPDTLPEYEKKIKSFYEVRFLPLPARFSMLRAGTMAFREHCHRATSPTLAATCECLTWPQEHMHTDEEIRFLLDGSGAALLT